MVQCPAKKRSDSKFAHIDCALENSGYEHVYSTVRDNFRSCTPQRATVRKHQRREKSMDYERVHLVKPEVFVYRIPPIQTNRAVRAADWKLDAPDWTGRLRLTSLSKELFAKLEDKNTGALFAKAPIDKHPGIAVQPVADSSRYFVLRLMDDNGRSAFIGLGFADRGDSFDFNVALQDFFKDLDRETKAEEEVSSGTQFQGPALDLAFKEGQTIRINLGKGDEDGAPAKPRSRPSSSTAGGPVPFLPPPPSGTVTRVGTGRGSGTSTPSGFAQAQPNPQGTNPFLDFAAAPNPENSVSSTNAFPSANAWGQPQVNSQPSGVAVDNLLDL